MNSQLCTLRETGRRLRRLGITMTWLRREAEAGHLPCCRVGRKLLFVPELVEQALVSRIGHIASAGGADGNEASGTQGGGQ